MQFVIRNPNLSTKAILKAVSKTGAGTNHHTRTIDFSQEAIGMFLILSMA